MKKMVLVIGLILLSILLVMKLTTRESTINTLDSQINVLAPESCYVDGVDTCKIELSVHKEPKYNPIKISNITNPEKNWNFEDIQDDSNLYTTIIMINETMLELEVEALTTLSGSYKWHMALCTEYYGDEVKYYEEDAQGGFNNSVPLSVNYGLLTDYGLPSDWCNSTNNEGYILFSSGSRKNLPKFRLQLPESLEEFELYYGDGTGILVGTGHIAGIGLSRNQRMVKDSSGNLYLLNRDSNRALIAYNSSDNGVTWESSSVIKSGTILQVSVAIDSNDRIYVVFWDSADSNHVFIANFTVGDGWSTPITHPEFTGDADNRYIYPDIDIDSDDTIHICVTTTAFSGSSGNDFLFYSNFSTTQGWMSKVTVNGNAGDDTDHCSIAVDSNNNAFILGTGGDGDDMDLWSSLDGWTTRFTVHSSTSDSDPALTIDANDNMYAAWELGAIDLGFGNSTVTNWETVWTSGVIDTDATDDPSIGVSTNGELFILHGDFGGGSQSMIKANSSDRGRTWTIRQSLHGPQDSQPVLVSIRGSLFPTTNRITNQIQYDWHNGSDDGTYYFFFNITEAAAENNAPTVALNSPANDTTISDVSPILLNVTPSDVDADTINLTFINSSNNIVFCTNDSLTQGNSVVCGVELNAGEELKWLVNFTDNGTIVQSGIWNFSIAAAVGDTCDTCQINCSENCVVDSVLDCGNGNLSFRGYGNISVEANITNCGNVTIQGDSSSNRCEVTVKNAIFCN